MKASLHNLGCKVNSYETEAMEQMLINAGYEIVPFDGKSKADVYIINTCSVTNIADRKSRQMLHRAKKNNPDAVVVAAGCYVQASGDELIKDEAVDIVIGNNRKNELISIIEDFIENRSRNSAVLDISKERGYENLSINEVCEHTRAYIKVQDGCNQFCSYCIIPYTRGRVRSRRKEDAAAEIERLAAGGYKEFVLTGIHLSSYGIDLEEDITLLDLIKAAADIQGVKRIRLGSFEPGILTEGFVSELARIDKVCPHFHISLQSGCDSVLKRMNRRYNTTKYEESCRILRRYFPNAAITTDVMVGFPQETEEEFQATKEYLERIHFYEMHVFKYSRRKGTAADAMSGQVDETVKSRRSEALIKLGNKMSAQYRMNAVGSVQEVLFEEETERDGYTFISGYTKTYIRVLVKEKNAGELINRIVPVKITGVTEDSCGVFGEIV